MEKLKKILNACKASVSIDVNNHRCFYQTVEEYLIEAKAKVEPQILNKMIEKNTIIEIQAYPDTPVGSYTVYHYDIDSAINDMLTLIFLKQF
jgi:hypothetical protein